MFVSFTKTLKKMSGFRLGFGVRVNKRNAPLWCFAMLFAGMFYLMWYMIIGAGWCLYFFLWAFYKIYYYLSSSSPPSVSSASASCRSTIAGKSMRGARIASAIWQPQTGQSTAEKRVGAFVSISAIERGSSAV